MRSRGAAGARRAALRPRAVTRPRPDADSSLIGGAAGKRHAKPRGMNVVRPNILPSAADPPARRRCGQPDRGRRGGRAAGLGGQGTGRERARRRGAADRRRLCRRRQAADPGAGRRPRHPGRRTAAGARAARHLQDRRHRPHPHPHVRLPRRGAALAGRGRPADRDLAGGGRIAGARRHRARRAGGVDAPGGAGAGHRGRARGTLLGDAGAAQVPAQRPRRGAGDRRRGAPARHGGAGHRLHADRPQRAGGAARDPAARRRDRATCSTRWCRGCARCSARISSPTRSPSTPAATGCASGATRRCRPTRAAPRWRSTSSSTAARCATSC